MAYRKIAVMLSNSAGSPAAIAQAATKALAHRDRLPEIERYLTTALYYQVVEYDPQKSASAYRSVLERDPDDGIALTNLAFLLWRRRQWQGAESLAVRAARVGVGFISFANVAFAQVREGRYADARATLEQFARMAPRHPGLQYVRALLESVVGDPVAAERELRQFRAEQRNNPVFQALSSSGLAGRCKLYGDEPEGRRRALPSPLTPQAHHGEPRPQRTARRSISPS